MHALVQRRQLRSGRVDDGVSPAASGQSRVEARMTSGRRRLLHGVARRASAARLRPRGWRCSADGYGTSGFALRANRNGRARSFIFQKLLKGIKFCRKG